MESQLESQSTLPPSRVWHFPLRYFNLKWHLAAFASNCFSADSTRPDACFCFSIYYRFNFNSEAAPSELIILLGLKSVGYNLFIYVHKLAKLMGDFWTINPFEFKLLYWADVIKFYEMLTMKMLIIDFIINILYFVKNTYSMWFLVKFFGTFGKMTWYIVLLHSFNEVKLSNFYRAIMQSLNFGSFLWHHISMFLSILINLFVIFVRLINLL